MWRWHLNLLQTRLIPCSVKDVFNPVKARHQRVNTGSRESSIPRDKCVEKSTGAKYAPGYEQGMKEGRALVL